MPAYRILGRYRKGQVTRLIIPSRRLAGIASLTICILGTSYLLYNYTPSPPVADTEIQTGESEDSSRVVQETEEVKDAPVGENSVQREKYSADHEFYQEIVKDESGNKNLINSLKSRYARVNNAVGAPTEVGYDIELFVEYGDGTRIKGVDFQWEIEGDVGRLSSTTGDTVYIIPDKAGQVWVNASYKGFKVQRLSFMIRPEYEAAITVKIVGNGQVKIEPNKATYKKGEKVTFTAIPDPGHGFDKWIFAASTSSEQVIELIAGPGDIFRAEFGKIIQIPDKNFEKAVREAISNPDGEILSSQVRSLTYLDISDLGVSSLEGIQYFKHLYCLVASGNNISDLQPLAGMSSIFELSLSNNKISNISALKSMTYLTYLSLEENQISNISVLGNLKRLEYLYLRENNISDISALANTTKLTRLLLGGNSITDFSPTSAYYDNLTNKDFNLEQSN